jgi:hypothetical protein
MSLPSIPRVVLNHKGVGLMELLSQTAKTMILGALITTARLWILDITAAIGYVTFRK